MPRVLALVAIAIAGCGPIGIGGSISLDEAAPTGIVLYQGTFVALSDSGVSGTASVVRSDSSGAVVLHLGSLSGVSSTSARVQATIDGTLQTVSVLRSREGSQNYTSTLDTSHVWTDVHLYDPVTDEDLAVALLQSATD